MAEKVMGENARIASQARVLAEFFRKGYKAASIPITLILVSQHRTTNIQTRASTSAHRGKAHPYFTTLELNTYMGKQNPDEITQEVKITFGKVHIDAAIQRNEEITLHLRPGHGFTPKDNAIAVAIDEGLITQGGSWMTYNTLDGRELKNQGSNIGKVADWLESEGLIDEVYGRLMQGVDAPVEVFEPDLSEEEDA